MYAATHSAAVRQLARRSPTTSFRSFAMHHSAPRSAAPACPVTPALRTAVAATLLVSFVSAQRCSHRDSVDCPEQTQTHRLTTATFPTDLPRVASLRDGLQHELRMAGVFGRSLGA